MSKFTVERAASIADAHKNGLTRAEIANKFNVPIRTQRRWMKKLKEATVAQSEGEPDLIIFNEIVDRLYARNDEIRILFMSDTHHPYADWKAIRVALKVGQEFNPHLMTDLNDAFDLPTLSKYPASVASQSKDIWEPTENHYRKYHEMIDSFLPGVIKFSIVGNHDKRVVRWLSLHAPMIQKTFNKTVVETIKSVGTLWLGWDVEQYAFRNDLLLAHGLLETKHAAKDGFDRYGQRFNGMIAGHVHRTTLHEVTLNEGGELITARSVTTGCLKRIIWGNPKSKKHDLSQLGFGLITIDVKNKITDIDPITICPRTYTARWGGSLYDAK